MPPAQRREKSVEVYNYRNIIQVTNHIVNASVPVKILFLIYIIAILNYYNYLALLRYILNDSNFYCMQCPITGNRDLKS